MDQVEFTGGPSLVSLYNDVTDNKTTFRQPKVGYTFKVGLVYNISERFSFNTNLAYERKGFKSKCEVWYYEPKIDSTQCQCTTSQDTVISNANLDYLTFSSMIRFNLVKIPVYFSVGPYVSYLIQAKAKRVSQWNGDVSYTHGKDGNNDFDGGISISLGYKIPLYEKVHLIFEIREDLELLNITNPKVSETNTTTNALSFQIGISFSL